MTTAVLEPELRADEELPGDLPARLRLKVTDTSGNNQLGCIWGIRSRYYDSAATAALFYEAEALTPINGAVVVTGVSGASGGKTVQITGVPGGTWVTMLSTTISATTGNWTHQGSYRVWARCYSSTGTPTLRFLWGVGSLSVPTTNTAATLPSSAAFYLLDMGEVRIDPPPVGTAQWFGAIQAYSTGGGDSASVDCIYLQPLDDGAGQLTYVYETPASSISTTLAATTGVNDATSGTVAWNDPSYPLTNIYTLNGQYARVDLVSPPETSNWAKAMGFGFAIPTGATIKGIQALRYGGLTIASSVRLVKAGTIQTADAPTIGWAKVSSYSDTYGNSLYTWGGPTDLWNTTWATSDVNNTQFGCALQYSVTTSASPIIDLIQMTVWYTLSSGFTVAQDAVVYANETLEIRYDGMWRQGPSSGPYGAVSSVVGDLARLAPSGIENRPCQIFVKPTRGDFNTLPDAGLDGFTVEPIYRPAWIFRP